MKDDSRALEHEIGQRYFAAIKNIWKPIAADRRIIPFCTPVRMRPRALVIGTNHAGFTVDGGPESEQIADRFAAAVPVENTFLEHDHHFARGLTEACKRAEIRIDATWMGTNRCAVQTDSNGLGGLTTHPLFEACQAEMDHLLHNLIDEISPKNVILAGIYACRLFPFEGSRMSDFEWFDMETAGGETFHVLPVKHFSIAGHWSEIAEALNGKFNFD